MRPPGGIEVSGEDHCTERLKGKRAFGPRCQADTDLPTTLRSKAIVDRSPNPTTY